MNSYNGILEEKTYHNYLKVVYYNPLDRTFSAALGFINH